MATDYKNTFRNYGRYYLRAKKFYQQPITKASLSLILTLFTISFFSFFAIKPTLITISELIREIKDLKVVNEKLEKKKKDLDKALVNYTAIKPDLVYLDRALPFDSEFTRTAGEIKFLANESNLIISMFNFGGFYFIPPEKSNESFLTLKSKERYSAKSLSFKIELNSVSYQDILDFISKLENLDRLTVVDSAVFSQDTNISRAKLTATIEGDFFWYPKLIEEKDAEESTK